MIDVLVGDAHAPVDALGPEVGPELFELQPEHDELRDVVRAAFARHSMEGLRLSLDTECGYSEELWKRLTSEVGIASLAVPESRGGLGMGVRELGIVLEECGAALAAEPILASAVLGVRALLLAGDAHNADEPHGNADNKANNQADDVADLLAGAMDGSIVVGHASTVDSGLVRVDHKGRASGRLSQVFPGAAADVVLTPATAEYGTVLAAIEVPDGVAEEHRVLDLTRRQAALELDGAPARILADAAAYPSARQRLAVLCQIAVASEHVGITDRLLDMTVSYVSERQQFGRTIGSFQAIKHRLADLLVARERARSSARYAAAALDAGLDGARLAAAVAGAVCSEAADLAAHEAVQLHGGIGFTWEHSAHLYLRRVLGDEGLFGSARDHRRLIADLAALPTSSVSVKRRI